MTEHSEYQPALLMLPPSIREAFKGEITIATVRAYHEGWAGWHRHMAKLNQHYKDKSCEGKSIDNELDADAKSHNQSAALHEAMAAALNVEGYGYCSI